MPYYLDQMLREVDLRVRHLADFMNVTLNFPDVSGYRLPVDGNQQHDTDYLGKCLSCAIQCANASSMVNVAFFNNIDSRFSIEISFSTALCNDSTFEFIYDRMVQLAPEYIKLNFLNRTNAPVSLMIDIPLAS